MGNRNWENYFETVKKQDWPGARRILDGIAKTESSNPLVYSKIGDICQRLGETANAVRAYHVAARIQTLEGFLQKALALYKIILRLDPGNPEAVSKTGTLLKEMEEGRGLHFRPASAVPAADSEGGIPPVEAPSSPVMKRHEPSEATGQIPATPAVPAAAEEKDAAPEDEAVIGGTGVPVLDDIFSELPEEGFQKMLDELVIPLSERQHRGAVTELFEGMPEEELVPLLASLETRVYPSGEHAIEEGDSGDTMYLIKSGTARVVAHILGREVELAVLGEGDLFGEVAFLTGRPRTASVIASGPLEVYELNRFDVERMIDRNPAIMSRIEDFYEMRVRDTVKKILPA
ncbi:MAG: cyclic nucleotide-binding domain-containing protein [Nitrospiraceae bacterium]|nr:cyclic nucleotide-binding domain-containing protein [Nitrospiraceae bacterium]